MVNLQSLLGGLKNSFASTVGPLLSNLSRDVKPMAQAINPVQNEAAKIAQLIPKYLNDRIQSNQNQFQAPSFAGIEPLKIVDQIRSSSPVQTILNRPLVPKNAGTGLLGYLQDNPNSPTIGEYFNNQVIEPLKSGYVDIQKPGFINKSLGALQILGGIFGSTLPGIAFNTGTGAVAGGIRSVRTGQDFQQSVKQGVSEPTSIASQGFGVENPWLALGLDLVITSPTQTKSLAYKLLGSKNMQETGLVANSVKTKERQLYELMNYENELEKRGFTEAQRNKLGIQKARQVLGWTEEAATAAIEKARSFAQEKQKSFDTLFSSWIGEREVAKTVGTDVAVRFAKIPNQIGWDVIRGLEGKTDIVAEAKPYLAKVRAVFDELHDLANKSGLDTNYIQSYVTHIYKQSQDDVQVAYKAAARQFKFAKERTIPTYDEAIKIGLTPLYQHPAQILEHYVRKLEEVKANLKFFNTLKSEGMVVDASIGIGKIGFTPITAPGIPPSISKNAAGETIKGPFYAPDLIAKLINKLFSPEDETTVGKILGFTARVAGKAQDIALSGGLPYSPGNAFSLMALGQKEMLAGRPKTIGTFLESFSTGHMLDWFHEHTSTIKEMQRRNIPENTAYKVENFIDKGVLENLFGGGIGANWDRAFNDKTFRNYLPALQILFFEDIRDAALRQGKGAENALDVAAAATKMFYGIVGSDDIARQTKWEQDLKTTLLFAPKFRESIINFWINNVKAISPLHLSTDGGLKIKGNNPFALQNIYNTRFVIGSTINYLLYDQMNLRLMGRHLSENPPGTETTLLIPISKVTGNKDDTTVIGIPFMSSLATLPRAGYQMATHASQGDFPAMLSDAKAFPSLALRAPMDILTNENYYGQQIYDVSASGKDKTKAIGRHLIENYSHPYMRAASELGLVPGIPAKNQPVIATASKALELPLRFYNEKNLNAKYYYGARDKAFKGIDEKLADFKGNPDDPTDDTQTRMTKASIRLSNPEILKAETQTAIETSKKTGQPLSPFYTLPSQYQLMILRYNSLPPGNADKKSLLAAQPWLKEYWTASSDFYKTNPLPTKTIRPIASDYVQQQLNNRNFADAQVQEYLNSNTAYTNSERGLLGLPSLPGYKQKSYTKKVKAKKLSLTLKGIGGKKLVIKAPKLKIKAMKRLKIRPIALRVGGGR